MSGNTGFDAGGVQMGSISTWSRGALEQLSGCPACHAPCNYEVTYERPDDSGLMPDRWRVHRCAYCGSVFVNPRMDEASIPAAYADYLTHESVESEQVFTSNATSWALVRGYLSWRFGLKTDLRSISAGRWLFSAVEPWRLKLDRFGRHITRSRFPHPGRLLDIGCGAGEFLRVAAAMGWSASGCDPDPKVVAMCRSGGLDVREGDARGWFNAERTFDVVTLNQVIEHVHHPRELLSDCFRLLRPGGMLWLGFPNPESLGARVFNEAWAGLHPPYHLCLPSQQVLRQWLMEAGYHRIAFQRRGSHAAANWRNSRQLAARFHAPERGYLEGGIGRAINDAVSTFTPRWGEETVVVTWRPSA